MTTYAPESLTRRSRGKVWLIAVVVLVATLVALGAWTVAGRFTASDNDAARIIDDLNTAVNAEDAEAVRKLFASDAVFLMPGGQEVSGLDAVVGNVMIPGGIGLRVERIAPVTTEGDFATTFIRYGGDNIELGVWQFEDGKIVRQWVYTPFEDAHQP